MTDKPEAETTITPAVLRSLMNARIGDVATIELPDGVRLAAALVGRGWHNPTPGLPPAYTIVNVEVAAPIHRGNADEIAAAIERLTAPPNPHAVHRVTVTAPVGKDEYFAAAEDWNTTLYSHDDRVNAYRIQHPADCDRLPYGQRCELDRFADDNAPSEMESWPAGPGEYTALFMVHQPTNEQGEPVEVQEYIRFEPAPAAEETTDEAR